MRIRLKTLLVLVAPPLLLVAVAYHPVGHRRSSAGVVQSHIGSRNGRAAWASRPGCASPTSLLVLLIRSGFQILADHPRLYWNVHCIPGTEWLRLTSVEVPRDRVWTSKDDSRHLSPWIGLPGYRHTVGMPGTGTS